MRVGFVLTNLAGGGAEKAVLKIGAGLAARGHRVDLVLLEDVVAHALPPRLRLHTLTANGRPTSKGWLGKRLASRRLARLVARLQDEERFRLIVSTLPFADEVALEARLPAHRCRIANTLSAEIARLAADSPARAERRLARYRAMYGGRRLIAVSQGVAADLSAGCAIAAARLATIPNPFDFAGLKQRAAEPAALPARPYLIHVGRFSAQKRHDVLLDAFARLPADRRLLLLAEADPRLERMIADRGLADRVRIAGFQQNPYPWIAGAALLVLSSDHEGLPNALIEAIALGVPVVSTDCPSGPREVLGAAFPQLLAPVGDAAALAGAIERALAERPDMARVDLSAYAAERVIDAYERLAAEGG
ncbi:MAG TPA: glycosyltransferase [Burkholderiales bacterium]|nr:glycosyltransferase [Burkholderiales bacterium]